jgi:hypothetical protein
VTHHKTLLFGLCLLATIFLAAACQTQPNQIFIEVDGGRQSLTTEVETVRQALDETGIVLGPLDKVEPDLYVALEPGMVIEVTRVTEAVETSRNIIPFEKETVVNEALAPGDTRLAQLGVSGEEEVSVRVVYENGAEVSRTEISRVTVLEPVAEILVVGPQNDLPPTQLEGTIAYLSNGNAWLMRENSNSRRALTTAGDLDGHVFSLSPDGRNLIYTKSISDDLDLPLNELWLASTTIVGEDPITMGLSGILDASWSPVVTQSLIAYSTAERTASVPGWRANNDLWLLDMSAKNRNPVQLIEPNTTGLYPWWGTNFTWSPDGRKLAYARADQIGVIQLTANDTLTTTVTPLVDFTPLETFSEWVWVPGLSWSPDSQFIAATVHGPPLAAESPEESQVFDLWLYSIDGTISARVAQQTGMWANPAWGNNGIAFGKAENALQSVNSRYSIQWIDRDGSNRHQIFPFQNENGVLFPELAWSPTGPTLLFIFNGNLYVTGSEGSPPRQLTANSQASQPQWAARAPLITETQIISTNNTITATATATTTTSPSVRQSVTPILSISATATSTIRNNSATPVNSTGTTTTTLDTEDLRDNNP